MIELALSKRGGPLRLLAIGSHADDIEIGCGGTILHLASASAGLEVRWVVLSADDERKREAKASAEAFLVDASEADIVVAGFRNGFFPYEGARVKEFFEELKDGPLPDVILTHQRLDLHQDHRLVSELTWNTFRNHLILEYEIPKYDGDIGNPNVFVNLNDTEAQHKVELLLEYFQTQRNKHWFTHDLFRSFMRIRAMESNAPSGAAEAFYCRKLVLGDAGVEL